MSVLGHGASGTGLPLPWFLTLYGAGSVVVVSFWLLNARPARERRMVRELPGWALPRRADAWSAVFVLRALGLLVWATVLLTALLGPADSRSNPAATWIYVWFWSRLLPLSILVGAVWRLLNPLRSVSSWLAGDNPRPLPARLGYWPAATSLFVFVWLELVFDQADSPLVVATFLTLYSVGNVAAGTRYGSSWFERGDGFEAYGTLLASLAPLARRLVLRGPLEEVGTLPGRPSLIPVACVVLGAQFFDGIAGTDFWHAVTLESGLTRPVRLLVGTGGLFLVVALVGLSLRVASGWSGRLLAADGGALVSCLVPVIGGYALVHSLLPSVAAWLGAGMVTAVRLVIFVMAHVLAVLVLHRRVEGVVPEDRRRRGQYPLVLALALYAMAGIVLVIGI